MGNVPEDGPKLFPPENKKEVNNSIIYSLPKSIAVNW